MDRRMLVLGVLAAWTLLLAGMAVSAQASTTYTVGRTSDASGSCEPASGKCSLRQLIEYDDAHPAGQDEVNIIDVPAGDYGLTEGELVITQPMVIVGAGARTTHVDRSGERESAPIFRVEAGSEPGALIEGLEISGGENVDGGQGGDIYNRGELALFEDWITKGTASYGGGVYNYAGLLVVLRSLVSNNLGGEDGKANGEGGGIESRSVADTRAELYVEDSTVADNEAGVGGGILDEGEADEESDNEGLIVDSTIAGNRAEKEFEAGTGGGGLRASDSKIQVAGSIVALNLGESDEESIDSDCTTAGSASIGPLEIPSYNLEHGTECGFDQPGELQDTNPDFSSPEPQNNGGETNTLAPEPTSPAVDAMPTSFPFCSGADQRGVERPQGSGCDIGAVELQVALSATGVPISGSPGVQLSGAVAEFTEANPKSVASDYTATISWGDGATSAGTVSPSGAGFEVSGSHTYASAGQYPTSVTIQDVGGAKATASSTASISGEPLVSNVRVVSLTATTATIGFTINPNGADTTYVVDYGPTTAYGKETERVDIGSTPEEQNLTRTITGLEAGHTYHFQVVATNALATAGERSADEPFTTASSGVLGLTFAQLPAPVLGKTLNVEPVKGTVLIALPGGQAASVGSVLQGGLASPLAALASLSKGLHFIPLTEARQVPVGSVLETTHGVVAIETATSKLGKLQEGDFSAGVFQMLQARRQKGLTELDIMDTLSARQVCATIGKRAGVGVSAFAASHLSGKVLGRLSGSAHGKFTTRGQYSAATVRGTEWSVANQCDGTLTKVKRGVVSVRDFVRRKTITLFTGQSYLARP